MDVGDAETRSVSGTRRVSSQKTRDSLESVILVSRYQETFTDPVSHACPGIFDIFFLVIDLTISGQRIKTETTGNR